MMGVRRRGGGLVGDRPVEGREEEGDNKMEKKGREKKREGKGGGKNVGSLWSSIFAWVMI